MEGGINKTKGRMKGRRIKRNTVASKSSRVGLQGAGQGAWHGALKARIQCESAMQGTKARIQCESAMQGTKARIRCESARQGTKARILCESAMQSTKSRIQCESAMQGTKGQNRYQSKGTEHCSTKAESFTLSMVIFNLQIRWAGSRVQGTWQPVESTIIAGMMLRKMQRV